MRVVAALVALTIACAPPATREDPATRPSVPATASAERPTQAREPVASRSPAPTSRGDATVDASERLAWDRVRAAFTTPSLVLAPTWLPFAAARASVTETVAADRYAVTYRAGTGTLVVRLMPVAPPQAGTSGLGLVVRGRPAIFTFDPSAFEREGVLKQISWSEGNAHYTVASDALSGDDVLRIAWSLAGERPPARPSPFTRPSGGSCSPPDAPHESVVQRALSLLGSGEAAIADCFALETLDAERGWLGWGRLPAASDVVLHGSYWFGGRKVVSAAWRFASDPGGAWGIASHRFFLVGPDGDRLRIYDVWSGPPGLPR
ncbi:MAG TPA: hypothetical protein VFM93_00270 [Candidatus Limnocylindria bacterium]|nr:hypothetical protein [Candidatus Limnocylindria bacterium]